MNVTEHVDVPAEISAWKAAEKTRARAREVQTSNAVALESAFGRGLSVIGYERNTHGDGRFLLGKWDEDLAY